ncbi:FAD-dependent oxidoreductase [Actinoplanes sp. NPDC051859]|uniref:FAD-dependent oxidoreductase n=1 Tax=Actinoplanes sp. NPDC051859 TaxID=3363909 RepID=UPI0037BBC551
MSDTSSSTPSTSVLVVGGGVVGLSAALFLARQGIPTTLIERHPGTSIHPRAWGWYPRTLELFRSAGFEADVLQAAAGFADHRINAKVESLTGRELYRSVLPAAEDLGEVTPSRQIALGQDRLEPLVRAAAERSGATLMFHTEAVDLVQDDDGVTVTVRDRQTDEHRTIRARYVIAADGARSPLREKLGVAAHGRGVFRHQVSILFRAALTEPLAGRRFSICQIENPAVSAILGHDDSLTEGTLIVTYKPEKGEAASDFTAERCVELVRAAIGVPELPVHIRDVLPWDMAALVAERYRAGRVFFAGDSAHVVPPIGGYGANTGVQDAHNLAWRLSAVLDQQAGVDLLDGYEQERRPLALGTVEQAQLRLAMRAGFATEEQKQQTLDTLHVSLGYRYGEPQFADPATQTAEVGTRAPHVWLNEARTWSTLDLFGAGWTVLAGPGGGDWADAAQAAAGELSVPVAAHLLPGEPWERRFAATTRGAVLVRPDGFVAYRWEDVAEPAKELTAALRTALHR